MTNVTQKRRTKAYICIELYLMRILILLILLSLSLASKAVEAVHADSTRFSDFVIALAWPKAWAKEAGDGYDRLLRGLGFNDGGFYRVGHAALILVDGTDGTAYYFDFGRYHTPVTIGRVRDAETDHELTISTKAIVSGKRILNIDAILCEINSVTSTHASGPLYASYVRINFSKAFKAAKELQKHTEMPYGPFEKEGLNCSRFVREIILAGDPNWAHALRIKVVPMITPTVLYPVSALYHWTKVAGCIDQSAEERKQELSALPDSLFRAVLPQPTRPENVPLTAQWLAGESAGSWHNLQPYDTYFLLTRYSITGEQECAVPMKQIEGSDWTGSEPFVITYLSHCAEVTLTVGQQNMKLRAIHWNKEAIRDQ